MRNREEEEAELSTSVERKKAPGTDFTAADQLFLDQIREDEPLRQSVQLHW